VQRRTSQSSEWRRAASVRKFKRLVSAPIVQVNVSQLMKVRRRLTGVLCGFLDAFASRYSDYDGYWIFGLLVRERAQVSFDLLRGSSDMQEPPVFPAAARIAKSRFACLLEKYCIPAEFVSEASVHISKLEPATIGAVNGRICTGNRYLLRASATSDLGKHYTAHTSIFIAPHDPSVEHRSTRRNVY
jgi:hypothetical protein